MHSDEFTDKPLRNQALQRRAATVTCNTDNYKQTAAAGIATSTRQRAERM